MPHPDVPSTGMGPVNPCGYEATTAAVSLQVQQPAIQQRFESLHIETSPVPLHGPLLNEVFAEALEQLVAHPFLSNADCSYARLP